MANGSLTAKDVVAGAAAGAAIGTAVPVIGTAVGAVAGAAIGGLVSLFSGGPEAQQQSANIGGRTIDARQVWEQISPGTSQSLGDGASAAQTLEQAHSTRASQIDALNQQMDAAWQGDASQAAQAGGHPLGTWLKDSASNLTKSHTFLSAQSSSFDTAKNTIQEIAAKPPEENFGDRINPFSDKDNEINKYNQQGQTNVNAFNAYYQASAQNAAGMPQFSAWQGNPLSDGGNGQQNPPVGGNGGHVGGGTGGYGGSGGSGSYGGPGSYGVNTPAPPQPISVAHHPVAPPPNYNTGNPPGSGLNSGTTASSYTPPPLTNPSSNYSSGFGPGSSGGFGPGGSGSGSGSGSGAFGGGAVGGFGPGGSGSLGAGASSGAGSGVGSGAAGRGGAGAGAGAAAGKAGTSGASGMGRGGGGKGSEDEEHQNKYLISEDPNELFGNDALTAPPVIGE
ncbi:MAG: PPE-repeat protein [Amycolatopsis sp.]|uniref:hypothetical protein n=1 Tax=Amycolatopsis sp. TaxID=37632 RepID=UPI00260C91A4|nr:hypothetical protein [Amycolatopsis sp.]MCU1684818.1 PPE-repeat protein [Amycolatopsis sp.]